MSTWYYYDNDGQKQGAVTGGQLKWLAKNGKITPETEVETESGKSVLAGKIKGLTFAKTAPPDKPATFSFPCPNCKNTLQAKTRSAGKTKQCPTCKESFTVPTGIVLPPVGTEIYGLASPPPEPSPFTVAMPETASTPVVASSEMENPFTATMPVVTKPTEKTLEALRRYDAATRPVENPFTVSTPTASRMMPQCVVVPAVEENDSFAEESTKPSDQLPIYMLVGVVLLPVLILIGVVSTSGGGSSGGGGQSVYRGQFTAAERAEIEDFSREFGGAEALKKLVNARDSSSDDDFTSGWTFLHYAAVAEKVAVAKFLVLHGANVTERDDNGNTPLHIAAVKRGNKVYDFLVSKGANVNTRNNAGLTPADYRRGHDGR